jgi:hypothetical protein
MTLQIFSRPKALRLLFAALMLSIVFLSVFVYRFGLYQSLSGEYIARNDDPMPKTPTPQRISRIRSHEIRNHIPVVRFHDPNEGPSDETLRIAYLIAVHSADTINGAVSILNRLYDSKHTFVIHLDAKADNYTVARLYDSLAKFKSSVENPSDPAHYAIAPQNNLIVLVNHPIHWCGFTMIQATYDMISAALQTGRWFDSVVLMSGSCHPVKPPALIEKKLKELRGMLLLELHGMGGFDDKGMKTSMRYDTWWFDSYITGEFLPHQEAELNKVQKNYPENLIRLTGTQWVFLSREFSEYIITSPWAKKLFVTHSSSHCADESMFQLIANNSPFVNNTFTKPRPDIILRYEDWGDGRQAHPSTITEISSLKAIQSHALFARKFNAKTGTRSFVDRLTQQVWSEESKN